MRSNFLQAEVMTLMWVCFKWRPKHFIAAFKWKLPFTGPCFISRLLIHSSTSSSLYCIPSWMICGDVIPLQCIAQIFHLNAAPGPSSIFYGTENSWVKTQLPLADAKYFLRWLFAPTYGFLHGGHYALCCRGQNFELDMRKPGSCLCYLLYLWPWTRDTLLLVFHIQLNRKSGRFLGSFLPPNVNKSIKLFCCFSRMSLYDVSVHCLGSGPLINSC